ncbi:MAG: MFS transporter [Arachidicoccus sp.]|nr:MFS transporter [Arachidicoccus sp.]
MSIAAGICVANIYYNQPILSAIANDVHLTDKEAGNLPVLSQAGYGLGLFFLTPLGDRMDRKKLIIVLQLCLIVTLVGISLVHTKAPLYILSLVIGMLASATQVILPMAASMSVNNKGKNVGIVFTGLLIGILGARIFSGYITEWFSWQHVYLISAGLLVITTCMISFQLPGLAPQYKGNYISLLSSTVLQIKRFSLLRRISLLAIFMYGAFFSFWTTLTFHLSSAPFHYKSDTIGLFGVLAIGGALVTPVFGKLADKGNPAKNQLFSVSIIIISILLVQLFPSSIIAFIFTTLLMDIGVQATQISNIAQVYSLDETANSRINTMYMTLMFMGGAIGTWVGVKCWAAGGWSLVCWQMLLWVCAAMVVCIISWKISVKGK